MAQSTHATAQHASPQATINEPKTYDLSQPIMTLPNGLTIRHHSHSDAAELARHGDNRKIARGMSSRWPVPYTLDKSHDWITNVRNEANWPEIGPTDPKSNNTKGIGQKLPFAWVIAKDGVAIGGVGMQMTTDQSARMAKFGYWLGEEYWRQGIMSVVVPAYVAWIWDTYPWLVKLQPGAYSWNTASQKLLEKCGFQLEGRLRGAVEMFGVLGDLMEYGLIREGVVVTGEIPE